MLTTYIEPERNIIITNEFVKVMNNASDSVAFAIWLGGYLYTPDTAMYQLVTFGGSLTFKVTKCPWFEISELK